MVARHEHQRVADRMNHVLSVRCPRQMDVHGPDDPMAGLPPLNIPPLTTVKRNIFSEDVKEVTFLVRWQGPSVGKDRAATYAADGTTPSVHGDNWPRDLRRAANISRVIALFWKGEGRRKRRECWRAELCDAGLAEFDPPLFT